MDVPVERNVARPHSESDTQLRGRQLGDFVLRECIGEGAFAVVYRSDQPLLGREAVVKVLHQRLRASEVALQRFMREARLASRLDHPYAAHVYAFGVEPDDGLAWIAMELVHGTSLERWLKERGTLSLDLLVSFFEDVAEVVQNAHDRGIVHRDLKPSNVMMIEYAGKLFPKLLDFGIAKLVDETVQLEMPGVPLEPLDSEREALGAPQALPAGSGNYHLTQANATLGSPPYMSPEQWVDALSVGPLRSVLARGDGVRGADRAAAVRRADHRGDRRAALQRRGAAGRRCVPAGVRPDVPARAGQESRGAAAERARVCERAARRRARARRDRASPGAHPAAHQLAPAAAELAVGGRRRHARRRRARDLCRGRARR